MLKIIGAAVVLLAAGLLGIKKYNELYERKRILRSIRDGAEIIRSSLKCMCLPLHECFLKGGEFFERAAALMSEGMLPQVAVKQSADLKMLKKEDRECVYRFADGLCAQSCDGQIRNIELFITELERNITASQKELDTKGKMAIKGSLLIASAVVLVLI